MASNPDTDYVVDPKRHIDYELAGHTSGIYVRAKLDNKWGSYDMVSLDRASLDRFLRSRGGENTWAEAIVRILIGHKD